MSEDNPDVDNASPEVFKLLLALLLDSPEGSGRGVGVYEIRYQSQTLSFT